jgi:hypothetical protein
MIWRSLGTKLISLGLACTVPCPASAAPVSRNSLPVSHRKCGEQFDKSTNVATELNKRPDHIVLAPKALKPMEAKSATGPCVQNIRNFVMGQIILSSGATFYSRRDGLERDPELRVPDRTGPANQRIDAVPGYRLVMSDRVMGIPSGQTAYVGIFKGRADYLIAAFAMKDGQFSRNAIQLVRSREPITAIDYFPAPDTLLGRIGFVERVSPTGVKLYGYDWNHGALSQLRF